jgi:hypothetical protein
MSAFVCACGEHSHRRTFGCLLARACAGNMLHGMQRTPCRWDAMHTTLTWDATAAPTVQNQQSRLAVARRAKPRARRARTRARAPVAVAVPA